ncbi:unnamed protein product [Bemisia tabaci]|uniref:arginine kinase n=2 Tax=Bemisia tabaci TaxID=7038 RepID=A0A9P0CE32_BEMTA|nr:unnamed protein product [Bemisia tabaci]
MFALWFGYLGWHEWSFLGASQPSTSAQNGTKTQDKVSPSGPPEPSKPPAPTPKEAPPPKPAPITPPPPKSSPSPPKTPKESPPPKTPPSSPRQAPGKGPPAKTPPKTPPDTPKAPPSPTRKAPQPPRVPPNTPLKAPEEGPFSTPAKDDDSSTKPQPSLRPEPAFKPAGISSPKKTDPSTKGMKDSSLSFLSAEQGIYDTKMTDAATLEKLEAAFATLQGQESKSLLKKYLTKEIFDKLKTKVTSFNSSLLDVIQSGVANPDSGVGIYAPDAESYSVFADLFDPIIEDYHGGFKPTDKHPAKDWGDVSTLGNLDPTGEYVISTRVRCGRSMEGYPFNPCLTEAQYKEMEEKVSSTLSGLSGELAGKFYPLTGMSKETQQQLIDDHFLFKEGDRFLQAANACRFWPTGRGIYHNDNKTFLVWCNEEDHLRLISMQMGGDLGEVYRRLVTAVNDIEKRIPFSHHDRLGFLTFCPTNLGTTVRASVHIKVPKLAANKAKLEEVASKFNLQVRGTRGEHTEAEGGIYDISNKRRMGLTEYEAVKEMSDGITELIKIEQELK